MNMKDIAKLCGVSTSTVSKILNKKDEDISDETRQKVLNVVKKYQYVPYSKIRQNTVPKTNLIGFVISEKSEETQEFIYAIEQELTQFGYSVIVSHSNDQETIEKAISILEGKNVEGIILLGAVNSVKSKRDIPIIHINPKQVTETMEPLSKVSFHLSEAGYLATKKLIEKGHSRIACILATKDNELEEGYIKALTEHNILVEKPLLYKTNEITAIEKIGMPNFIQMAATAIVCSNTEYAYIVYKSLYSRGISVPDEISVVSAVDSSLNEMLSPSLSAVTIPYIQLGVKAVHILIKKIENNDEKVIQENLPLHFIERNSIAKPPLTKRGGKIVVVGSMNMDIVISVPEIPTDGDTIISRSVASLPGGKGGNQAVGVAKLGGLVHMIGRIGSDSDGNKLYQNLLQNNVFMEGIVFDTTLPTGKAFINTSTQGGNSIVVYPGANQNVDCNQINQNKHLFEQAAYCLVSFELPIETIEYTINLCHNMGLKVIVKPSTVEKIKDELFGKMDYFIPNEKELTQIVPGHLSIEEKAEILVSKGVKNVIVTLGKKGCYVRNKDYARYITCAPFTPIDTTGASDAFISAFSVFLSEGYELIHAIHFATYAAGISITRQGVQSALPDRVTLNTYFDDILQMEKKDGNEN